MTIKHKHHIIPRHMGGSDDQSNLIELTVEEHAEAHRILFKEHGRWQDKIAWKMLSGQINNAEAIRLAGIAANTGKIVPEETRKKPKSIQHKLNLMGPRPHVNQCAGNNNNAKKIQTPYGIFDSIKECALFLKQTTNTKENHNKIRYIISQNLKSNPQNWSLL